MYYQIQPISDLHLHPRTGKLMDELMNVPKSFSTINAELAKEEFKNYIKMNFPIYVYKENDFCLGYLVCRVDKPVVWVESLYVLNEYRRKGIASILYSEAEKIANSFGEDTLYNYVHPNNDPMINFLYKKGYNVLNLIEIRKNHKDEKFSEKIMVRNNEFNY